MAKGRDPQQEFFTSTSDLERANEVRKEKRMNEDAQEKELTSFCSQFANPKVRREQARD